MSSEAISREDSDSSHDHVDFDMKVQGLLAFAVQLHGPKASVPPQSDENGIWQVASTLKLQLPIVRAIERLHLLVVLDWFNPACLSFFEAQGWHFPCCVECRS